MSSHRDGPLQRLLDAFAEPSPTPGGGSAAALAAATGASLLIKAARIAKQGAGAAANSTSVDELLPRLQSARQAAIDAIDRDAAAYSAVISARRMPRRTEAEAEVRRRHVAEAMRIATETPLDTLRASRQALSAAPTVAARCTPSTGADVRVAIELLRAAARGAALTVAANLPSIGDPDYAAHTDAQQRQLSSEADADADRAAALLEARRA
jgi:formiminotetrahydrofolate cyclodeaminase